MHNLVSSRFIKVAACVFAVSFLAAGLSHWPTTVNSQIAFPQMRSHVEREIGKFEGRMILSSFFRGRPFQQPAQGEKTVEQVQKNIQILKGMPESQLGPVMNYIATSLGVKCDFCHVNNDGEWNFAADEKPHKATAREMMKMVLSVNKTTFRGATEVTCFTCHRGRSHPTGMPFPFTTAAMPGAAPAPEATPAPSVSADATAKETQPTADQILDKYMAALGGPAAIDKLKTRSMKGTFLTSNGISLGYEVYQSIPDHLLAIFVTPRQGTIERGFNGQAGWEKTGRGLRDIQGQELHYLRRYPGLLQDIKLKEQFTRLTFAGTDKIGDREVYVLRGATADNKRERLYFDRETGFLLRRITTTPTMLANIPEQIDFEDYRDVDGMKLPFTIRIASIDSFFSSTRKFTEMKLNVPVDASRFNRPAPPPPMPQP